ncbi:MAG: cell division protein ZapE, partial [Methylococcales bacterium]
LLEQLLVHVQGSQKSSAYRFRKLEKCRSIYIFGDVGRGKSMLMDFYDTCPFPQKRRVHFHAFMLEVHAFIFECRQKNHHDAIPTLAKNIRQSTLLLCFDEFNVTDIADAMILQRLFKALFEAGVVVVMTSNRHPKNVYRGGLLKEQFLLFTKMLLESSEVIELTGKDDYRLSKSPSTETSYFFPLSEQACQFAQHCYQEATQHAPIRSGYIEVLGRKVLLSAVHKDVAMISFAELCAQPLGAADYLKIAGQFSSLILVDIPRLTSEHRNEAKRFVTLIDALYENKVKLICTAEVSAKELYVEGDGAFEFARTVSRLIEMQSEHYLYRDALATDEWEREKC